MGTGPNGDVSHSSCTRRAANGAGIPAVSSCHGSRDGGMKLQSLHRTEDTSMCSRVGPLQGTMSTVSPTPQYCPSLSQMCCISMVRGEMWGSISPQLTLSWMLTTSESQEGSSELPCLEMQSDSTKTVADQGASGVGFFQSLGQSGALYVQLVTGL